VTGVSVCSSRGSRSFARRPRRPGTRVRGLRCRWIPAGCAQFGEQVGAYHQAVAHAVRQRHQCPGIMTAGVAGLAAEPGPPWTWSTGTAAIRLPPGPSRKGPAAGVCEILGVPCIPAGFGCLTGILRHPPVSRSSQSMTALIPSPHSGRTGRVIRLRMLVPLDQVCCPQPLGLQVARGQFAAGHCCASAQNPSQRRYRAFSERLLSRCSWSRPALYADPAPDSLHIRSAIWPGERTTSPKPPTSSPRFRATHRNVVVITDEPRVPF
jgi:hypothetical protein